MTTPMECTSGWQLAAPVLLFSGGPPSRIGSMPADSGATAMLGKVSRAEGIGIRGIWQRWKLTDVEPGKISRIKSWFSDVRCCCRACRLTKCLLLGMKADAVQRHRDNIGPRKRNNDSPTATASPSDRVVPFNFPSPLAEAYPSSFHPSGLNHHLPVISTPPSVSTSTFFDKGKTYALLTNAISPAATTPSSVSSNGSSLVTPCFEHPSTSILQNYSNIISTNSAFTAVASSLNTSTTIGDAYTHLLTNAIYSKLSLPQNHPMPLCTEILRGYKKLCSLRKTTNRLKDEAGLLKLFDDSFVSFLPCTLAVNWFWCTLLEYSEASSISGTHRRNI